MKKRVQLGQNPIVVQAALNAFHKLYEKLSYAEKIQFKQLVEIEQKIDYFKNIDKLGDIIEQRKNG